MSPSFDAIALTAAPYLGNGLGWAVVYVNLFWDHGYSEALGLVFKGCTAGAVPLFRFRSWQNNQRLNNLSMRRPKDSLVGLIVPVEASSAQ